jgi:uncharacterized protein (TIGR03435 family)
MRLLHFALVLPLISPFLERAQAPTPSFEVASIKPSKPDSPGVMLRITPGGKLSAQNVTLKMLTEEAYDVKDSQISQAPPWFDSDHYDIEAKPEDAVAAAMDKLPPDQRKTQLMQMVQGLLADRFKLQVGHDTKDFPVYALVVAKNGPKLKVSDFKPPDHPADLPPPAKGGAPSPGGIWMQGPGNLTSTGIDLKVFATVLSRMGDLGRIVVDKTGLTGRYDFTLKWTPDNQQQAQAGPPPAAPSPESSGASLFTAIQEQLGLKLEPQKAPMDVLVIQHVEKPSAN